MNLCEYERMIFDIITSSRHQYICTSRIRMTVIVCAHAVHIPLKSSHTAQQTQEQKQKIKTTKSHLFQRITNSMGNEPSGRETQFQMNLCGITLATLHSLNFLIALRCTKNKNKSNRDDALQLESIFQMVQTIQWLIANIC